MAVSIKIPSSVKYTTPILGFLIFHFLVLHATLFIRPYRCVAFFFSYRDGFGGRALVGSVVDGLSTFLTGTHFISSHFVHCFLDVSILLLLSLMAWMLGRFLAKMESRKTWLPCVLTLGYLIGPFSPLCFLYSDSAYGVTEMFSLLFLLCTVFLLSWDHPFHWLIPVLAVAMIAAHTVTALFFVPVLLLLLLYSFLHAGTWKQERLFLLLTTVLLSVIVTVYFVIFSKTTLHFSNAEDYLAYLNSHTDWKMDYLNPINAEYFWSLSENFNTYIKERVADLWENWLVGTICMLPIMLGFFMFWRKVRQVEPDKAKRLFFWLCQMVPLVSVPAFIIFMDWGRWWIMLATSQVLLLFWLLYQDDKAVHFILKQYEPRIKKWSFPLCIFIFCIYFSPNPLLYQGHTNKMMDLYFVLSRILGYAPP